MNFIHPISGEKSHVPWTKQSAVDLGYKKYMDDQGCTTCKSAWAARYVDGDICVQCAVRDSKLIWKLWNAGSPERPDGFVTTREQAADLGENSYYRETVCSDGPHFVQPHIKTGRCVRCEQDKKKARGGHMDNFPEMVIEREEAASIGWSTYRTGEPCKRGHVGWRYVTNGGCLMCMRGDVGVMQPIDMTRRITVNEQLLLFIGHAWDGRKIINSNGRKMSIPQFNISVGGRGRYEVSGGRPDVFTSHEAFMLNFVSR